MQKTIGIHIRGALSHLMTDLRLGANQETRLQTINAHLQAYQRAHPGEGNNLPPLRMENLTSDGWANLSGRVLKAAMIRKAAPFFKDIICHYYPSGSDIDICLRGVVTALDRFYKIIYGQGMFMDDGAVEELRLQCLAHGECYQALREMARRDHRRAWNVTPKCHNFQHIHVFASIMNPRFVQN